MAAERKWESLEQLLLAISDVLVLGERPIDVATHNSDNDTPLHIAAVWGDVEAIDLLASAGAKIDAIGDLGTTPLYSAVSQGNVEAAIRLFQLGASPHIRSELNFTPMELARDRRYNQLVRLFAGHA